MYNFFNLVIDLWIKKCGDKMKLAYQTETTLPTIYKVCNHDGYNLLVISQMWSDLQPFLDDEEKLQFICLLNLL